MATGPMNPVIACLRRVALHHERRGMTDGRLLQQFLKRHDGEAFAELVRRHGPMVLSVCERILRSAHDAEDAFQATFLVLARKAASVVSGEMVGSWLYGVAQRTALKARTAAARRRRAERQAGLASPHEARQKARRAYALTPAPIATKQSGFNAPG
jgi:DNA-directed RNA polymerase specialized sigma24 family protein